MRLALALQTMIGAALALGLAAGVHVLLRPDGPRYQYPWAELSARRVVLLLVLLATAWLLSNGPTEGRILWSPLQTHGLTVADLLAVPPLLLAAAIVVRELVRGG
jgi:hypothetical protein